MNARNVALAYDVETEEEDTAYTEWLRAKVQEAMDDPTPPVPHDQVMAKMFALVERLKNKHKEQT